MIRLPWESPSENETARLRYFLFFIYFHFPFTDILCLYFWRVGGQVVNKCYSSNSFTKQAYSIFNNQYFLFKLIILKIYFSLIVTLFWIWTDNGYPCEKLDQRIELKFNYHYCSSKMIESKSFPLLYGLNSMVAWTL